MSFQPHIPPAYRATSSATQTSTARLDVLTPESREKVQSLKREGSLLSKSPPPTEAKDYLKRLAEILDNKIMNAEADQTHLLKQKQFLREDIQNNSMQAMEVAYLECLYFHRQLNNDEDQTATAKISKPKQSPQMEFRKKFRKVVAEYLGTVFPLSGVPEALKFPWHEYSWCTVTGQWLESKSIECAHIVPFDFDTTETAYLFGVESDALKDPRNGLFMYELIEKGFDRGWIAIVPYSPIESNPIEWKVVLLNDKISANVVIMAEGPYEMTFRWRDLDGRKLRFPNQRRPARRYMYFRYIMTYIHAARQGFANFREKLPSGSIWASPSKKKGYLRASVLRALNRKAGDDLLPEDLLEAGTFVDTEPATGVPVRDKIASLVLSMRIRKALKDMEHGKGIDEATWEVPNHDEDNKNDKDDEADDANHSCED